MSPDPQPDAARERRRLRYPRPGHADLAGALKYGTDDLRNVLERASARETTARVAAGALARALLRAAGAEVRSHVLRIGGAVPARGAPCPGKPSTASRTSPVRCADPAAAEAMIAEIDRAKKDGDTRGRRLRGGGPRLPAGLGSFVQWDRKLDGRIAQALMSIHAVKAVAIGEGFAGRRDARLRASTTRSSANDASGLERPTQPRRGPRGRGHERRGGPRPRGGQAHPHPADRRCARWTSRRRSRRQASVERSDTCVVPAAGVVGEAMLASSSPTPCSRSTGGDSLDGGARHLQATREQQRRLAGPR